MKSCKQEVKSAEKIVGEAEYPEYETLSEAVEGLTEKTLLEKVNAQVRTDAMNRVRALFNKPQSKTALRNKALARITQEQFMSVVGDQVKFEQLVDRLMGEIQKEEDAAKAAAGEGEEGNNS